MVRIFLDRIFRINKIDRIMAEQIIENGGQPLCVRRASSKSEKRRTNKEIRRLPLSMGARISRKDVIKGWEA